MSPSLKEAIEFDKRIEAVDEKLQNLKQEPVSKKVRDTLAVLVDAENAITKQRDEAQMDHDIEQSAKYREFCATRDQLSQERNSLVTARNALLNQIATTEVPL